MTIALERPTKKSRSAQMKNFNHFHQSDIGIRFDF